MDLFQRSLELVVQLDLQVLPLLEDRVQIPLLLLDVRLILQPVVDSEERLNPHLLLNVVEMEDQEVAEELLMVQEEVVTHLQQVLLKEMMVVIKFTLLLVMVVAVVEVINVLVVMAQDLLLVLVEQEQILTRLFPEL